MQAKIVYQDKYENMQLRDPVYLLPELLVPIKYIKKFNNIGIRLLRFHILEESKFSLFTTLNLYKDLLFQFNIDKTSDFFEDEYGYDKDDYLIISSVYKKYLSKYLYYGVGIGSAIMSSEREFLTTLDSKYINEKGTAYYAGIETMLGAELFSDKYFNIGLDFRPYFYINLFTDDDNADITIQGIQGSLYISVNW